MTSNFGTHFQTDMISNKDELKKYLAGTSELFSVKEIEVYKIA